MWRVDEDVEIDICELERAGQLQQERALEKNRKKKVSRMLSGKKKLKPKGTWGIYI